jgi:hypothetical protein
MDCKIEKSSTRNLLQDPQYLKTFDPKLRYAINMVKLKPVSAFGEISHPGDKRKGPCYGTILFLEKMAKFLLDDHQPTYLTILKIKTPFGISGVIYLFKDFVAIFFHFPFSLNEKWQLKGSLGFSSHQNLKFKEFPNYVLSSNR